MVEKVYTSVDKGCMMLDNFMRTVFGQPLTTDRQDPATAYREGNLNKAERRHAAALMRVNHCGEVCAQALYQGQSLTAKQPEMVEQLQQAAAEENDHLAWCASRLQALGSHKSYLNPFFYLGALTMGATAGLLGDQWSLGFLTETEKQVEQHLTRSLDRLPKEDKKSEAVMLQMREDEKQHADTAQQAGAKALPLFIKQAMVRLAKVMTGSTYYL